MCMKVRVTEGTLQESCHDLQTEAESVDQKERMDMESKETMDVESKEKMNIDSKNDTNSNERDKPLPINPTENLVSQEEDPDLLDNEMESVLRQVVRSNRVDVEVMFVSFLHLDANSITPNQTNRH